MGAKESRLPKPPCDPHKSWIPWRCDDDRPSQGILVGGWVGGWVRVRVGGFVSVGGWASDKTPLGRARSSNSEATSHANGPDFPSPWSGDMPANAKFH